MSNTYATKSDIRYYQLHRWLNPFAKQRAVMVTPLEPEEINETLRSHLFTWRYSHIPYDGLYGSINDWGFVLKRSIFQQPGLTAKYGAANDGTRLDLELGRSLWGVIGWGLDVSLAPFAAVIFALRLFSHDILGPPHWIDIGALWQPGAELPEQPGIWLLFAAVLFSSFVRTIVDSYRQRDALDFYRVELASILDARELTSGS